MPKSSIEVPRAKRDSILEYGKPSAGICSGEARKYFTFFLSS